MTSDHSFTGDLLESFRWIADVAVMEAFESNVLDLPDFYFTGDDYRYRFDPEAKQRFLDLLRERFNAGVKYNGHTPKWDTVIEQKTVQLGYYLANRTSEIDFCKPSPNLRCTDDWGLRKRVLGLSKCEAQRIGIAKSTLHYLRENARQAGCFRTYRMTARKLVTSTAAR